MDTRMNVPRNIYSPNYPDGYYPNNFDGYDYKGPNGVARWYRPDGTADYGISFVVLTRNGVATGTKVDVYHETDDALALTVWQALLAEVDSRAAAGFARLYAPWHITKGAPA